ncbi:MAG: D-alanyl-D-alanine carboxypeptidase [Verrucomicrobia bacterium]|nr:MAG: D-alanyl-D-alanine carboxypeptidase [Verrucomicrobiota bacterium]
MIRPMIVRLVALLGSLSPLLLHAQAPESLMVVEAYSGKILVAANSSIKRPVSSLNQLATSIVAVDWATATAADISQLVITAPPTVALVGGPNPMHLQPGDKLTLRDALYSTLLGSDNLAALTIADHIGSQILAKRGKTGDPVAAFVVEMNRLAELVGMTNTKFVNPHGLERPRANGYSCAADVARLSIFTMRRNALNFIVRQKERQINVIGSSGKRGYLIHNPHELLGAEGLLGIKTGASAAAGPCLTTCMDREPLVRVKPDGSKGATPRRLIVVLLNSPDRFSRTRSLLQQGWSIYDAWLKDGAPVTEARREILAVPAPN